MFPFFIIYGKVISFRLTLLLSLSNLTAPYLIFSTVKIIPGGIEGCYKNSECMLKRGKEYQRSQSKQGDRHTDFLLLPNSLAIER